LEKGGIPQVIYCYHFPRGGSVTLRTAIGVKGVSVGPKGMTVASSSDLAV
jgi:hypothetical protein